MLAFARTLNVAIFLFLGLLARHASGQIQASGDIFDYAQAAVAAIPGSSGNDYTDPTGDEHDDWTTVINLLLEGENGAAHTTASQFAYEVVEFSDTVMGRTYTVLQKQATGDNHWGTYVLNPSGCRSNLVIMAPHPRFDTNTGVQGAYCFQHTDAFALMLAGTHRCNHDDPSPCSGNTSVCSQGSQPYRISDLAHTTTSAWQLTTQILADSLPSLYFAQLHGFGKQASDPYLILSNGTRVPPDFDPLRELQLHLEVIDPVLTFKIAHIDSTWTRLIGFTNTNGRYINQSADPCGLSATISDGRFMHIEQERTRLRSNVTGWDKMARALAATFRGDTCDMLVPLDDHTRWFITENGTGDGKSWDDAAGNLRAVLHLTDDGDTVMLGAGTYFPSFDDKRDQRFDIQSGITIWGGFPAAGGTFVERDWQMHPTILSGDIGAINDATDNTFRLLEFRTPGMEIRCDGMILKQSVDTSGTALYLPAYTPQTGGILSNILIRDIPALSIIENHGNLILQNIRVQNVTVPVNWSTLRNGSGVVTVRDTVRIH